MRKLRHRRVVCTCPRSHNKHMARCGSAPTSPKLTLYRLRHCLLSEPKAWPACGRYPPPASQQLHHIARCPLPHSRRKMTMKWGGFFFYFLKKEREKGAEGGRKLFSSPTSLWPSSQIWRFWHGWRNSEQERRENAGQQRGSWGSRTGCSNLLVGPAPKDKLHNCEAGTKWKGRTPWAKIIKNFKRVQDKHKAKCRALLSTGSCVAAEVMCPGHPPPSLKKRPNTTQQGCKEG